MNKISLIEAVSVAGTLLGTMLAVFSIYLTVLWRRRVQPYYSAFGRAVLSAGTLEQTAAELTYRKIKIKHLETSRLIFWNGGSETFGDRHVIDPVTIEFSKSAEILESHLVAQSLQANELKISSDGATPNQLRLTFRYLDPGHFAVVDMLHTGRTRHLRVSGIVEGAKRGIKPVHVRRREALAMSLGGFTAGSVLLTIALEKAFGFGTLGYAAAVAVAFSIAALSWWATNQLVRLPSSAAPFSTSPDLPMDQEENHNA